MDQDGDSSRADKVTRAPAATKENPAPDTPPIDTRISGAEDGAMEARIAILEADVTAIKIDVAVTKANVATKVDVAEAKVTIILWVVGAIFLGQILPHLIAAFGK